MGESNVRKSAATARAERAAEKKRAEAEKAKAASSRSKRAATDKERKSDRAEMDALKKQRRDVLKARRAEPWGRDWTALDREQRGLLGKLRGLRRKKYD
jgi:hypothetical protein